MIVDVCSMTHGFSRLSHAAAWMSTISSRLLETKSHDVGCHAAIETLKLETEASTSWRQGLQRVRSQACTEHHLLLTLADYKMRVLSVLAEPNISHVCVRVVWVWYRRVLHPCHFEPTKSAVS